MKIENYGVGERYKETLCALLDYEQSGRMPPSLSRALIMPIPTSRDGVHISGSALTLDELFSDLGEGDAVFGYGIPKEKRTALESVGAHVFDAEEDEAFLSENAFLTALGTLGYILTEFDRVPGDITFGIVGYGRIGRELCRILLFFGARVRIYTSRELTRLELGECGVETVHTDYITPLVLSSVDVLINTAPTDLSASFPDGRLHGGIRVLELASGENFPGVEGVERLMSLPGKMYARSAALAYFRAIEKYLNEVF